MRAVVFTGKGGPEVVEVREVEDPSPARGEVLVRVRAAALNRADLLQRRGLYPPPRGTRADIPGLELAGEVLRCGEGVSAWKPGDRVMAVAAGEAQAELAVVHERMLLPVPPQLSWEEAGAVPEAFLTSHDALFTLGGLRPGWPVLIHAAGSGISTAAIQLVKACGATAIGTSRTAEKLERARALGLDHGILVGREEPRFAEQVRQLTGGRGAPLILDFVGASYLGENLAAVASGGRIVCIGTMGGVKGALDMGLLLRARATVVGTVLRPRPLDEKIRATQELGRDALPLLLSGRLKPVLDRAVPLERVRETHEQLEQNDSFGKVVLTA
ncbi:MAG TPA: NAD(P)H-quinone oxidoreductase [Anaeromyxobacteraceae bacterium]|jgi:putative PIG3 family NAD(P)H quinone oxidoreductase|nr:NAD(P)H-quinone oxidoreductase [Anaeromyxobacteraceae bacterium]